MPDVNDENLLTVVKTMKFPKYRQKLWKKSSQLGGIELLRNMKDQKVGHRFSDMKNQIFCQWKNAQYYYL